MTQIKPATNSKQLKQFLGMVNFYQDVLPKQSHILVPLNKLSSKTGKLNLLWTNIDKSVKVIITRVWDIHDWIILFMILSNVILWTILNQASGEKQMEYQSVGDLIESQNKNEEVEDKESKTLLLHYTHTN